MNKRILLLDECRKILDPYKWLLEKEGYEVFTAQNVDESIHIAAQCLREQKPIRVVIYDPEFSQDSRFLVVLGVPSCVMHCDPEVGKVVADHLGYSRFLRKPFGREELSQVVAESLREANYRWN